MPSRCDRKTARYGVPWVSRGSRSASSRSWTCSGSPTSSIRPTTRTTRSRGGRGVGVGGRCGRLGGRLLAPAVVAVEPGALEDHADGVEHLAQPALALGAVGQRVVAEALDLLEGVAALACRRTGRWARDSSGGLALDRVDCQIVPCQNVGAKRVIPAGRDRGGHRAVVRLHRHLDADLVVVEQHAGERPDRHPAQRPVVGAAAAPEPLPAGGDREPRQQHRVGGGDGVRRPAGDPPARAGRTARAPGPVAGVRRPVEVAVREQHREQHPLPGGHQRVQQGSGAGLGAHRDVRRDRGRPAHLGRRGEVQRDLPRRLGPLQERPPVAGRQQLVAQARVLAPRCRS